MAAILAKLIEKGWGTSGYYSEEVLRRDGPSAFPKGTLMYWNHATRSELRERPERNMDALAAVIVSDPIYNEAGPEGSGLYAHVQPFSDYAQAIKEKGPYTGLSIFAAGKRESGEADGRQGYLVTEIQSNAANSVDIVTRAGAGGRFLFEASDLPDGIELLEFSKLLLGEEIMENTEDTQSSTLVATLPDNGESSEIERLKRENKELRARALIDDTLSESLYDNISKPTKALLIKSLLSDLPDKLGEQFIETIRNEAKPFLSESENVESVQSSPTIYGHGDNANSSASLLVEAERAKKRLDQYLGGA